MYTNPVIDYTHLSTILSWASVRAPREMSSSAVFVIYQTRRKNIRVLTMGNILSHIIVLQIILSQILIGV